MEAKALRELGAPELKTRVTQWREELFRSKLKKFGGEAKDTTASRKLRRNIARALTVLGEKTAAGGAPVEAAPVVEDKPKAAKKPAKKASKKKSEE